MAEPINWKLSNEQQMKQKQYTLPFITATYWKSNLTSGRGKEKHHMDVKVWIKVFCFIPVSLRTELEF